MALESATYVNDLVSSNPGGTDNASQGDDHIRLVKAALKTTFPNSTRASYFQTTLGVTNHSVLTTEDSVLFHVDASGAPVTITLPAAPPYDGFRVGVFKGDATANAVTVNGNGYTINDASTVSLALHYLFIELTWSFALTKWLARTAIGVTPYYSGGQDIPFSDIAPSANAKRLLGAATATDFSEQTIATVLEWLGTAARGDIILRGASAFAFKNLGTSGYFLKSDGTDLVYGLPLVPASSFGTYASNSNLTTAIPYDDTIPQVGEGTEIISASITPIKSTSIIRASFMGFGSISGGSVTHGIVALFKDGAANAVQVCASRPQGTDQEFQLAMDYEVSPGSLSAITFSVRAGPDNGTMRFNGTTAARKFGGASFASLSLKELFTA